MKRKKRGKEVNMLGKKMDKCVLCNSRRGNKMFLICSSSGFLWRPIEEVCYKKFNHELSRRVNHALMGGCSSTERLLLRSEEILGLARKPTMSHPAALYYFLTFVRSRSASCSTIHPAPHWELPIINTAPYWALPIITTACNWSALSRSTAAAVRLY